MPTVLLLLAVARAQDPSVPRRAIPPSVLAELAALDARFEMALAADCASRCFSRGCTYGAHVVSDRAPAASLPGLGQEAGPSPTESQAWLTKASCSFAYEPALGSDDASALARRLGTKVGSGWTVVSVGAQGLPELPPALAAPVEPAEAEPPPPPPPEAWTRQLWNTLLDDFPWMTAVVLVTLASTMLIWAWRRVGQQTVEEKALLAELERGGVAPEPEPAAPPPAETDAEAAARQSAAWRLRLQAMDRSRPDPELQTMIRDLLRANELPLLAKAVLTFPDTLPLAFPNGGDVASAKLELAEYLKTVDPGKLPTDAELFAALDRYSLAAALATQRDAEIVRSLREEFGATGLVTLIQDVPARAGALLFALAPGEVQHEMVRLLSARQMGAMAEQLLRSNRMDAEETAYLFEVLEAARGRADMPHPPPSDEVSDRGAPFDATAALSVLLPKVAADERAAMFTRSLQRFGGSLPAWYGGIVLADMLLQLPEEARADLLLGVEVDMLAAWLSLLEPEVAEHLVVTLPAKLQTSVRAASVFPSRLRQVALADGGRRELARGLQAHLARTRVPFEQVVRELAGRQT